jgi:caffeoyl-CoA O-methyltransferase
VDADKSGYLGYFEELVPRLSPRGVILVDNVLWDGQVVDERDTSTDTEALRVFNAHVVADPRVEVALLPIGDGLSMIRLADPVA